MERKRVFIEEYLLNRQCYCCRALVVIIHTSVVNGSNGWSLCFRRNSVTDLSDGHPFLISLLRALLLSSPTTILPEVCARRVPHRKIASPHHRESSGNGELPVHTAFPVSNSSPDRRWTREELLRSLEVGCIHSSTLRRPY